MSRQDFSEVQQVLHRFLLARLAGSDHRALVRRNRPRKPLTCRPCYAEHAAGAPDDTSPRSAAKAEEKQVVARAIAAEEGEKTGHTHLIAAFSDGRVWLLSGIYSTLVCAIYIISFWLPLLIKQAGVSNPMIIGLLTAVPYIAAIVAMIGVNTSGDRFRERRWHTLLPALVCGVGLVLTAFAGTNIVLAMVG